MLQRYYFFALLSAFALTSTASRLVDAHSAGDDLLTLPKRAAGGASGGGAGGGGGSKGGGSSSSRGGSKGKNSTGKKDKHADDNDDHSNNNSEGTDTGSKGPDTSNEETDTGGGDDGDGKGKVCVHRESKTVSSCHFNKVSSTHGGIATSQTATTGGETARGGGAAAISGTPGTSINFQIRPTNSVISSAHCARQTAYLGVTEIVAVAVALGLCV